MDALYKGVELTSVDFLVSPRTSDRTLFLWGSSFSVGKVPSGRAGMICMKYFEEE